ncbi:MAG TPA: AAA family ATPase [Polyangiaceae bacterium]|nr:AAA family ATPase [Polyangiaceae bacterium]
MRSPMVAAVDRASPVFAGRYRVEKELARGGMGVVYAVYDESTKTRVALKRLDPDDARESTRRKGPAAARDREHRFGQEYAMLVRLRHPSIIEVYDYGVDQFGPYYTMELLDGRDLIEVAPAGYREACRRVRDVASSLALLHAHRLVHRDVSPRNVRATLSGRSKLFDFGTLTPLGVPADLAGTPSCVPPEALAGEALDHRADLYSLGCLLYLLLTGREAFAARRLDDLPKLFEHSPPPPSAFVSEIPEGLDALVLSMLSRDRLARPSSAAEVIERLDALGRLYPEERSEVAESYLQSAKTVGRAAELAALSRALERALASDGSDICIVGDRGLGKTRLVRDLALEAHLRGATAIAVDASLAPSAGGTLSELAGRLLEAAPEEAILAAAPYAERLGWLAPEAVTRHGALGLGPLSTTPEMCDAFERWLVAFAARRPLVVVVDNIDAVDEACATTLTSLRRATAGTRLLVIVTARTVRLEDRFPNRLPLGPLDPASVSELVSMLFGRALGSERVSAWIHALSAGVPLHCMELMSHLVSSYIATYADGAWTLPEELRIESLPKGVEQAILGRLSRLRPAALSLAESFSVSRVALPVALCIALAERQGASRETDAPALVDDLVTDGVLIPAGDRLRFAEGSLRERLAEGLDAERARRLHRELGEWFSSSARCSDKIAAGYHLLNGGEEPRGVALLTESARLLPKAMDELPASVPALEAALETYRTQHRTEHEVASLVGTLAAAGFFVDRRLATRYGAEALELLGRWSGAGAASSGTNRPGGVALFLICAASLSTSAAVCLDVPGVRRILQALEPHVHGRNAASLTYRYVAGLEALCRGRFGKARSELVAVLGELERRDGRVGFPDAARRLMIGGALAAIGTAEALRDGCDVLDYAERLERLDLRPYDMIGDQLRMLYYLRRGERVEGNRYGERVESYAIERGSAWQVQVWQPVALLGTHIEQGNIVGLKWTAARLAALSREISSLKGYERIARAACLRFRGEYRAARSLLEPVASLDFSGRSIAIGVLADVYNSVGDHARAETLTRTFLDGLEPDDRGFARLTLLARIQHARSLSGMGDVALARRELERAIEESGAGRGPVTLGLLHQARARLALEEGDERAFELHRNAVDRWFRPTHNPVLVSACERLLYEARRGYAFVGGDDLFDADAALPRAPLFDG